MNKNTTDSLWQELTYIGFNLKPDRDEKIMRLLADVDKGARGYVIRKILNYHITNLTEEDLFLALTGNNVARRDNVDDITKNDLPKAEPKIVNSSVDLERSKVEESSSSKNEDISSNKSKNKSKKRQMDGVRDMNLSDSYDLPPELEGLAAEFG